MSIDTRAERFPGIQDMVDRRGPDECWPWNGRLDRYGYGKVKSAEGRDFIAHRVIYEVPPNVYEYRYRNRVVRICKGCIEARKQGGV